METYENESINPDPAQVDTVDNILIESHKYTASKLGLNIVFILVIAFFFGLLSLGIDSLARSRMNDDLLSKGTQEIMSRIFSYGIYFNCVSLISVFFC